MYRFVGSLKRLIFARYVIGEMKMSEHKEKSAADTAMSEAEKENAHNSNIAQVNEKSKPVLAKNQRMAIVDIYRHSKNLLELVNRLSSLEFCNLETAADVLVEQGYITQADKEYLTGQHIFIYIRKYHQEDEK